MTEICTSPVRKWCAKMLRPQIEVRMKPPVEIESSWMVWGMNDEEFWYNHQIMNNCCINQDGMKINQFQREKTDSWKPPCQAERKAAERTPPDLSSMMSSTGLEAQLKTMSLTGHTAKWLVESKKWNCWAIPQPQACHNGKRWTPSFPTTSYLLDWWINEMVNVL